MARIAASFPNPSEAGPAPAASGGSAPPAGVLSFQPLHESPVLTVRSYCCRACRDGPGAEERADGNEIVLLRHGAFARHFGCRSVVVDVNQAAFFSRDSEYRVSHPVDCGDEGTVIAPSPGVLNDIVREFDPGIDDHPDRPFPFATSPCDPALFREHRRIAERLEAAGTIPLDPLRVDEALLGFVARVLHSAFERHDRPRRPQRAAVAADHAERAEAAKAFLASRLGERITLQDVADAVHASPFHFARAFRQHAGVPVHRYLTQLRLRSALERLAEGADDLAALAAELGFASHSHFADAFRREFGLAPSAARRQASRRRLGEMRKIPEAGGSRPG